MTVSVVFDARALSEASGYRGIGTYQHQVLAGVAADSRLEVRALAVADTPLPAGVARIPIQRKAPGRFARLEHEVLLPLSLYRHRSDVFHSPAQDAPRACPGPWVQTLYDLIPLTSDDPRVVATRDHFRRQAGRYRKATAIIAISQHVADEGIRLLGLDPGRVHVVWLGVDPKFHPGGAAPSVDRPYLLLVGEYESRKSFEHAFEAVAMLAEAGKPHRLLIAGRVAPWVEPALSAAVARARRPDRIEILGFVDDLAALYRDASVLLHPSRQEGFGLPLVEAMASGTPVVAYANSAVPEIVADAGELVSDGNVGAFCAAVHRVVEDSARHEDLATRGLERATAFRWSKCVERHAEIYLEAVGARGGATSLS